jgi:flagellin
MSRDAKGTIDGAYFQSATNAVANAGGRGLNLTLTGNTAPSDPTTNANILVDQGISNAPLALNASSVSVNEGANAGGTIFNVNDATYQLDSHNQVTVGGVTYTYHGGTGSANVDINATISNKQSFGNGVTSGIEIKGNSNSALDFQSGATSNFHVTVHTSNVLTGASGASAGGLQEMMALGTSFSKQGAGNIFGLSASTSASQWQSAFMRLSSLIDKANDRISTQRMVYGSQLNTISYNVDNLKSQSVNLQDSKSKITDTNFALESSQLAKGQIMEQAATAVAAQANQQPNIILGLLDKSFTGNYNIQNFVY